MTLKTSSSTTTRMKPTHNLSRFLHSNLIVVAFLVLTSAMLLSRGVHGGEMEIPISPGTGTKGMVASSSRSTRWSPKKRIGKPCFINKKNKEYSPLCFFTVPRGEIPSCDAMDKLLKEMEKDGLLASHKHVDRFDVRRNVWHRRLLQMVTGGKTEVPVLYHRESRQKIYGMAPKEMVREWAKGRWIESSVTLEEEKTKKKKNNVNENGEEDDDDDGVTSFGGGGLGFGDADGSRKR